MQPHGIPYHKGHPRPERIRAPHLLGRDCPRVTSWQGSPHLLQAVIPDLIGDPGFLDSRFHGNNERMGWNDDDA